MKKKAKRELNDFFRVVNLLVLPFWLLMLLAPRASLTKKVMNSRLVFMLMGGVYTSLLAQGLRGNPGGFQDIANPNLDGIVKLLANPQGAFTGWTHFLTFDLFVGRWIYFDSLQKGKTARLALLLTFMAGPLGLMYYLARGNHLTATTIAKS
ncbi:MAG TPA: ABA4-like family protein [Chloroflexia bacterium]|nr:ABA4-like family protein [Chloroflexia bacterium]